MVSNLIPTEQSLQSGGTKTRKEIILFSDKLPKENPLRIHENLSEFSRIDYAELKVSLSATSSAPIFGWNLDEIRVNGKKFIPQTPLVSTTVIHKLPKRGESITLPQSLNRGNNLFEIFRSAPIGTGVIFEQVFADVKLIITGELSKNPVTFINSAFGDFTAGIENTEFFTKDFISKNTPLAVALLIIFAIIIIGGIILLTRAQGITSDVRATSEAVSQ